MSRAPVRGLNDSNSSDYLETQELNGSVSKCTIILRNDNPWKAIGKVLDAWRKDELPSVHPSSKVVTDCKLIII